MKAKATILVTSAVVIAAIGMLYFCRWRSHTSPNQFLDAIGSGNVEGARQLIQQDPAIVDRDTLFGVPPLIEAADQGKYEIVELLANNRANINAHTHARWGKTALHLAAQKSEVKIVEFLLKHGADVNARDDDGFTPIIDGIRSVEVIKLLLAYGADINAHGRGGANTAFSQVLENPGVAGPGVLQLLLDKGVDVTVSGEGCLQSLMFRPDGTDTLQLLVPYYANFKNTAARSILEHTLGEAMDENRPKAVSVIVSSCLPLETNPLHKAAIAGDDTAVRSSLVAQPDSINQTDIFGWTPLQLAAISGQPDIAETLLSNGANIDAQDPLGHTPLCWAAFFGHAKFVEVLLRHNANMDLVGGQLSSPLVSDWNSPLDFAIQQGFTSIALRLVANGASIKTRNACAATPLHFAAIAGNGEAIQSLLAHGAAINAQLSTEKQTPLDYAVAGDSPESVRLLIANGADLKTETYAADGGNLLHLWASKVLASKGNPEIADQLRAAGCDVNGKDNNGKTPLDVAVFSRQGRVITYLLDHQAEINITDKDGLTPLHYAVLQCDKNAVQLLLDRHADVNAADNKGRTPLAILREQFPYRGGPSPSLEYPDIAKLLLAHGAKEPASPNPANKSPLEQ
jgi:ankyrin repeat protein